MKTVDLSHLKMQAANLLDAIKTIENFQSNGFGLKVSVVTPKKTLLQKAKLKKKRKYAFKPKPTEICDICYEAVSKQNIKRHKAKHAKVATPAIIIENAG